MSNKTLRAAAVLAEAGIISQSKLRRIRIHCSYWALRDTGLAVADAQELVADNFGTTCDCVAVYARRRDRYSVLDPLTEDTTTPDGEAEAE